MFPVVIFSESHQKYTASPDVLSPVRSQFGSIMFVLAVHVVQTEIPIAVVKMCRAFGCLVQWRPTAPPSLLVATADCTF